MATQNFYLDRPDRKGECPIMLIYQFNGKKFKYYTKEKVSIKAWDAGNQKVKRNYAGEAEINRNIDKVMDSLKKVLRDAGYLSVQPTPEYVKRKFLEEIGHIDKSNDFYSVFKEYVDSSKLIKTKGTVANYNSVLNKLKEFAETKKWVLTFDSINNDFYEKFVNFLIDQKHLNNSIGKTIKTIKSFMNYATAKGFNKNMAFMKFKVFREDIDIIYLTENELMEIYNLKLDSKTLEHVRDSFCFSCFTGLRFSDLSQVSSEYVKDDYLSINITKTKELLKIPLNDYAKEILSKYKKLYLNSFPPVITNQKTNMYLKQIAKDAKLNDLIQVVKYNGSRKIEEVCPKHELICTHTARRTFVTLALEKGIRPEVVMSITGHKDYRTFKKYIKITDKVKLVEMNRVWRKVA